MCREITAQAVNALSLAECFDVDGLGSGGDESEFDDCVEHLIQKLKQVLIMLVLFFLLII